jgi:hypothetical protein
MKGGKVEALPTEGSISALNVPHSSMVFDLASTTMTPRTRRHADLARASRVTAIELDEIAGGI